MQILRSTALAVVLLALHPAGQARTPVADMYAACQNFKKVGQRIALPPDAMQSSGMCMGFIEGASEALYLGAVAGAAVKDAGQIQTTLKKAGVVYACLPVDRISNFEKVDIFMRYFEKYEPAIRQAAGAQGSALNVLMLALGDAYPCK